jgi:hypothetical protein
MKKIYNTIICKDYSNKSTRYVFLLVSLFATFFACKESLRFEIGYSDSEPPSPPEFIRYEPLYGGARIFFAPPRDRDVLSVDASYINEIGKKVWFTVSYYTDSIDVFGFSNGDQRTVQLYAVDRAGNKSTAVDVPILPFEPAVTQVASTVYIKNGFGSFYVDWQNVLKQNINMYIDFTYTEKGVSKERHLIYTSNLESERRFIRDLELDPGEKIHVFIRVEDRYGNITESIDMGEITLLEDMKVPKDKWVMPKANDSIGGEPQAYLDALFGRDYHLYDDIIDDGISINVSHTMGNGRTGRPEDGNMPYNIMIDLGDYYELSRIITHQRYNSGGAYMTNNENAGREEYYRGENVGIYRMYLWDDDTQAWDTIAEHKITFPLDLTDREYRLLGAAGDIAYMYPDDPQFTKPTRWFRYEALFGFDGNYTAKNANCISEITLYAKKK